MERPNLESFVILVLLKGYCILLNVLSLFNSSRHLYHLVNPTLVDRLKTPVHLHPIHYPPTAALNLR